MNLPRPNTSVTRKASDLTYTRKASDLTVGSQGVVPKRRTSDQSELFAEEEKDEEDSDTIRIRMKEKVIILPKWVVEQHGTDENIVQ